MANPKFLSVEKKVPYSIRLPQRLIERLNGYAELTGNTTTNVINNILDDFLSDKVVLNDYLENVGGLTVKIPCVVYQKHRLTSDDESAYNLLNYSKSETYNYEIETAIGYETISETYFAELFEIKKIPNNLDINNNDSYVANKKTLLFNDNATHSGIELFIYNIADSMFADATLVNEFDSFTNCLYCLYFEVDENNNADVYLIDYMKAINLLSASGNENYKDLIIAVVTELNDVDEIANYYFVELDERKADLTFESEKDYAENYEYEVEMLEKELQDKYLSLVKTSLTGIADKYNSGNIIAFGTDIFSRIMINERNVNPDYFDEIISEKADHIISEKLDEIIADKIRTNK